jgi:hypothetical protein
MTFTVTMSDTTVHEVYGGLPACDAYLFAAVSAGAKKYRALPANGDDRKRLLVQATRWIDDILAACTPTGAGGTTLQVPVEGAKNADGSAMSDADQLALANRATFEAVAILAADQDAAIAVDTGSNVKKLDADGASIEFFRPTSALDGTASAIPMILARILAPLLAAASGAAVVGDIVVIGGSSHGTCEGSSFDDCDQFRRTGPF